MLSELVLNIFLKMLEGLLWVSMIVTVISGAVVGYNTIGFFGALLGIIFGVVITTVSWGFMLLFIDIRNAVNNIQAGSGGNS